MTSQEFIFSNKPAHRFIRHLSFWACFSLHFIIQNLLVGGIREAKTPRTFAESSFNLLYFLPFYIISTYCILEVIFPSTLYKRKYILFTISILAILFLVIAGCNWSGKLYIQQTKHIAYDQIPFILNRYHVIVNGIFVPLMIWGIAGGFKLSKKWYEKQKENEQLARQKIATEIKLLKIQVHPRFLFHTLNTVQQQVQVLSKEAPLMVLQLADILSFLLYESDEDMVSLEKEIEIMQAYINLQKAGEKLIFDFDVQVTGDLKNKLITPLTFFSLTESFFENFLTEPAIIGSGTLVINSNGHNAAVLFDCLCASNLFPENKIIGIQSQMHNLYPLLSKVEAEKNEKGFTLKWILPVMQQKHNPIHEEKIAI